MKNRIIAIALAAALLVLLGCTAPPPLPAAPQLPGTGPAMPGSDRDAHGCIGSAGYTWCEQMKSCIRPWETSCPVETQVRILTENFPPYNFQGATGAVDGKSSEVVRLILERLNQTGKIELVNWPDAYALALSQPNVALYSSARTPQREKLFKWVGPIGTYGKALYAKNGSALKVKTLEDALKAKSVCAVKNDDRAQLFTGLGFANLVYMGNDSACLQALANGEVELWLGSPDTMPYSLAVAGLPQGTAVEAFRVEKTELYIMFSNSTPDSTVKEWQDALDGLKLDGVYDALMEFWGAEITPGSDIDLHGCIGSAGYLWCPSLNSCTRRWEAPCPDSEPGMLVGNDTDEHGCKASAGYTWCPELSKCVQIWVDDCPSVRAKLLVEQAKTHCAAGSKVFTCGQYIKVVSGMDGAGSKFYRLGDYGEPITCPVVSPDYMTPECRQLLLGNNCVEQEVDCGTSPPKDVSDLKDDPNFAGAQLTWSKPDSSAVDYEIYRGNEKLTLVSLIKTTSQTSYNDVFNGGNQTYSYFVRARNAAGQESAISNIVYVKQLGATGQPSPGQIG